MDGISDDMSITQELIGVSRISKRITSLTSNEPFQLDGAEHNSDSSDYPGQDWSRRAIISSNTWTSSSGEHDDIEDRTDFLLEYNRLAVKHGIRGLVPDDYESDLPEVSSVSGKADNWFKRNILRRTSSTQSIKHEGRLKHRRSISDLSIRLRPKKSTLKDKDLQELIRLCGLSLLYLPAEYAFHSLPVPTCFRATAQFLLQHAVTTRGIFRIPGSHSVVAALYNHYCTLDGDGEMAAGTVRCPTLPAHIKCDVHDVASAFKRFLSGLPGGILGSLPLFYAMVSIQSQLDGTPELMRTKQSKIRARLIVLAILTVRSQYRRDLICAVFGLLSMIGRAAETARREDDRGRPLPTSDLMGYVPLGIIFGPLLIGEMLDNYTIRLTNPHGGLVILPVSPPKSRKDRHKKSRTSEEGTTFDQHIDKFKVANSVAEMLITHWRDVVRMMKDLKDPSALGVKRRSMVCPSKKPLLRPSVSESFILRRPPTWDEGRIEISNLPVSPSPRPQLSESLIVRKQRSRPTLNFKFPQPKPFDILAPTLEDWSSMGNPSLSQEPRKLNTSKSMGILSNPREHLSHTMSPKRMTSQKRSAQQSTSILPQTIEEHSRKEHKAVGTEKAPHEHKIQIVRMKAQSQLSDHEHRVQVVQDLDLGHDIQLVHKLCQTQANGRDHNSQVLQASTKPEYSINDDGVRIVQGAPHLGISGHKYSFPVTHNQGKLDASKDSYNIEQTSLVLPASQLPDPVLESKASSKYRASKCSRGIAASEPGTQSYKPTRPSHQSSNTIVEASESRSVVMPIPGRVPLSIVISQLEKEPPAAFPRTLVEEGSIVRCPELDSKAGEVSPIHELENDDSGARNVLSKTPAWKVDSKSGAFTDDFADDESPVARTSSRSSLRRNSPSYKSINKSQAASDHESIIRGPKLKSLHNTGASICLPTSNSRYISEDESTIRQSVTSHTPGSSSPKRFSPERFSKSLSQVFWDLNPRSGGATPGSTSSISQRLSRSKYLPVDEEDGLLQKSKTPENHDSKSRKSLLSMGNNFKKPASKKCESSKSRHFRKLRGIQKKGSSDKRSSSSTGDQVSNKRNSGQSTPIGTENSIAPDNRRNEPSFEISLTTPTQPSRSPASTRTQGLSKGTVRALAEKFNTADLVSTFIPSPTRSPKKTSIYNERETSPYPSSTYSCRSRTRTLIYGTTPVDPANSPSSFCTTSRILLDDDKVFKDPTICPSSMLASTKTASTNADGISTPFIASSLQKMSTRTGPQNIQPPNYSLNKRPQCSVHQSTKSYSTTSPTVMSRSNPAEVSLNPISHDLQSPNINKNKEYTRNGLVSHYTTNASSPIKPLNPSKSHRSIPPQQSQDSPKAHDDTSDSSRDPSQRRLVEVAFNGSAPLRSVKSLLDSPNLNGRNGLKGVYAESTPPTSIFPTPPRKSSLRGSAVSHSTQEESSKSQLSGATLQFAIPASQYAAMEVPMSLRCVDNNDYEITRSQSTCPIVPRVHYHEQIDLSPKPLIDNSSRLQPPAQNSTRFQTVDVDCSQTIAKTHSHPYSDNARFQQIFVLAPAVPEVDNNCTPFPTKESLQDPEMVVSDVDSVGQHTAISRPPAKSQDLVAGGVPTRSNSILHCQVQVLQHQLDAKSEEIRRLKQQIYAMGRDLGVSSLCEQLKVAKRDVQDWRARALVAEKQIVALTGLGCMASVTTSNGRLRKELRDEDFLNITDGDNNNNREIMPPPTRRKYSEDTAVVQERIRRALRGLDKGVGKAMGMGMDGALSASPRCGSEDSTDTVIRSFLDGSMEDCGGDECKGGMIRMEKIDNCSP